MFASGATTRGVSSYGYARVADKHQLHTSSAHGSHKDNFTVSPSGLRQTTWTPRSLSKTGLLSLAALFVALLAGSLVLWALSKRNDGLPLISTNHYTWTYGPTAVLVIVISFWRQVDYHCKILTPWQELRRGPVQADKSIFLDYTSPFILVTLVQACKNRHLSVITAIVGFLVLKLITIVSTGLLALDMVMSGPHVVELRQTSVLNGSSYNLSTYAGNTDPSIVYTAYAVAEKGYPFFDGATGTLAYERFEQQESLMHQNATITTKVRTFVPLLSCEPIEASINYDFDPFNPDGTYSNFDVTFSGDACPYGGRDVTVHANNPYTSYCRPRQLVPVVKLIYNCSGNDDYTGSGNPSYLVALADQRYSQTFNKSMDGVPYGTPVTASNWTFDVDSIQGILCRMSYTVQDTPALSRYSSSVPSFDLAQLTTDDGTELQGFNSSQFSWTFELSIDAAYYLYGGVSDADNEWAEQPVNTILGMMVDQIAGDYHDLFNNLSLMQSAFEPVYQGIAVQLAQKILVQPANLTTVGSISYPVQRLQIVSLSLWIMVSGFVMMIVCVVAIMLSKPTDSTKTAPDRIAHAAAVCASSPEFKSQLQRHVDCKELEVTKSLSSSRYSSKLEGKDLSVLLHQSATESLDSTMIRSHQAWWSPITLSPAFLLLTVCATTITIAALLILQSVSDRHLGIASLEDYSDIAISVITRYLPAFVILIVTTLYNSLDFNAALLAPFGALRTKPSTHSQLDTVLLTKLPPLALYYALNMGYWASALTSLASFIGSILTIVVSGLYTVQYVPGTQITTFDTLNTWNTSWPNSLYDDNGACIVSGLVETANLSYPSFTYGELVLPRLEMSASHNESWGQAYGTLKAILPALRAELTCDIVDSDAANLTVDFDSYFGSPDANLEVRLQLPSNCQRGSAYGNESFAEIYFHWQPGNDSTYFAQFTDIHVGPYDPIRGGSQNEIADLLAEQPDNPPGCPTIALAYGVTNYNDQSQNMLTTLMCYQEIKSVQTNVTFNLPGLTISTTDPPVPDESTAELLRSGSNNETAFWWRPQNNLESRFALFADNTSAQRTITSDIGDSLVQNFFLGVLKGRTPVEESALADPNNPQVIRDHIQAFYRRYMAQAISANMRSNITSALSKRDESQSQGKFTPDIGAARLVQHRLPALIIGIALAFMLCCGALAWVVGDFHHIVPWNPCTIAGTSILLADSKMCEAQHLSSSMAPYPPKSTRTPYHSVHEALLDRSHGNLTDDDSLIEMRSFRSSSGLIEQESAYRQFEHERSDQIQSGNTHPTNQIEQPGSLRYRLGWWRDGQYVAMSKKDSRHMTQRKAGESGNWRYGIDVL